MLQLSGDRPQSAQPLHELLAGSHQEIVRRWTERVRHELGEGHLSDSELLDSMPALLRQMEDAVRMAAPGTPGEVCRSPVAATAAEHGGRRAVSGTDINHVVWEYGVLRDVILDLVADHRLLPTLEEVRALTRALSTAVAASVAEFAAERDRALRETTDRLREIADHAPAAIFVRDAQGRFEFVNAMFAALVGKPRDALVGKTYAEVLPPALVQYFAPIDARVARGATIEIEDRFPTAKGERVVHMVKFPLPGEPGAIGVIGLDVTDRNSAARHLQQAHEFEQQLIGIVSHDLRGPLGTITLSARTLLARDDLREPHVRAIARILSSGESALRMISDLLDLARARVGGIPVHPRRIDLADVVAVAVEEYRTSHPDRRILFHHDGDTNGRWDRDRVVQALGNLVVNAVKYGAPGAEITVRVEGEPDRVRLSVHNWGDPIPESVLPTLFHPGFRHRGDRTDRGFGLGLYIVERIAAAHGGTVEIASTAEAGTTFSMVLPRDPRSR